MTIPSNLNMEVTRYQLNKIFCGRAVSIDGEPRTITGVILYGNTIYFEIKGVPDPLDIFGFTFV
jgi:hypothetical protein